MVEMCFSVFKMILDFRAPLEMTRGCYEASFLCLQMLGCRDTILKLPRTHRLSYARGLPAGMLAAGIDLHISNSEGVVAVVRSLPPNPEVPGSIPDLVEG